MSDNTTPRYIVELDKIDGPYRGLVGTKAFNLSVLVNSGIRVPTGFVITTEAYRALMSGPLGDSIRERLRKINYDDPSSVEDASQWIRSAIDTGTLPPNVIEAICTAYSSLKEPAVAVRSSASAEDLPGASFAGQYFTSLCVRGKDAVIQGVLECYRSLWSPRAIIYRHDAGIPHDSVNMAVLVQIMVDARGAGVMFTKNPVLPTEKQIVIESNFGLGESVVAGYATPDRYTLSKTSQNGATQFKILSTEIGTKSLMVTSSGSSSGTTHTEVPVVNRTQASLLEEEAVELASIGTRIENVFGVPQDIEWAIDKGGNFHILQSRPITLTHKTRLRASDEVVWSRGYSDDYWNDNVTPLFFNLLGDQLTYIVNMELNSIMGYRGLPKELLRLFRAHAYFNLDVLKLKVMNEIPPFLRSEDILNYFPEGCGPYGKDTVRKLPFRLGARLLAEVRVAIYDPNGGMNKTATAYERWTRDTFEPFLKRFDLQLKKLTQSGTLPELMSLADELDHTMRGHFRLVRYGIPVHNIGMNLLLKELTRRFLGEEAARVYFPQLISGLRHKTTETNRRIVELAQLARSKEATRKLFMEQTSDQILATLASSRASAVREFAYEFRRFLTDMGERGFTREPYYPRWGDAPQYVLDVIKSLVREAGRDIVKTESMAVRRRVVAEEEVRHRIRRQRLGALKWLLFSMILKNARRYIVFRENQRFNLDRWITRNRRVYLEIGRRLTEHGIIERPELIFFLYRSEIRRLIRDELTQSSAEPIGVLASQRYREFKENEDKTPPKFLQGQREYEDRPTSSRTIRQYTGIAASEGIVRGRVRVLERIEDIPTVCEGEILVVPRTDPGWTPVFSKIAGLITETGGVLSHGAVVSREYGIPAVTNVRNACQLFRNGDEVTLDGIRGIVSLHDQE